MPHCSGLSGVFSQQGWGSRLLGGSPQRESVTFVSCQAYILSARSVAVGVGRDHLAEVELFSVSTAKLLLPSFFVRCTLDVARQSSHLRSGDLCSNSLTIYISDFEFFCMRVHLFSPFLNVLSHRTPNNEWVDIYRPHFFWKREGLAFFRAPAHSYQIPFLKTLTPESLKTHTLREASSVFSPCSVVPTTSCHIHVVCSALCQALCLGLGLENKCCVFKW